MNETIKFYQLASGDSHRDFSQVMLDFGVAIVGPGNPGRIEEARDFYINSGEWSKLSWLEDVKEGDIIVMRSGQSYIQAIGEVISKDGSVYHHSDCFEDIDGWDLQHYINVKWKNIELQFEGRALTRSTVTRLRNKEVINKINSVWDKSDFIKSKHSIVEPDKKKNKVEYNEIEQHLINHGFRISDAINTSQTIERVEKLASWYRTSGLKNISEHEIRTYLVIPFLEALGWPPQKMAIEWNKVDILLFKDVTRQSPYILVETKSMWTGSNNARAQALGYLNKKKGLEKVNHFIITDGLHYWLHDKNNPERPKAYMSFIKRQRKNPAYPKSGGILDFFDFFIKNK